ncbi:EAL domain-containing protein [Undibacterium sp. Ji22W]|uniref:EAL domain-containing protein n=1 Tax=Undibacterium sp. Ji22W TaxID=3413038 RepID=UPI003BF3A163
MGLTRRHFILFATLIYIVFALGWIFLSDHLLALFVDYSEMLWLSTVKGIFFVIATATLFYFSLHAVPPEQRARSSSLLNILAEGAGQRRHSPWLVYGLTLILTLAMFMLHRTILAGMQGRPTLILFIFPIVLSAMLGGFWPGLLSTSLAASGIYFFSVDADGNSSFANPWEQFRWFFFVLNGLAISFLSELLKRSQATDDKHRRLLDAIVTGTTDAVYVKDLKGRYVLANQAIASFLECPLEEVLGADDSLFFDEETTAFIKEKDKQIFEHGVTQSHEAYLHTRSGKKHIYLATKGPLFDEDGKVVGLFGISHDISERKRIEEDLRLVLQEAGDAIWITNPQGQFLFANPAACRLIDYSLNELQGMSISDLLVDASKLKLDAHLRQLEQEKFIRRDWPIVRRDGTQVQVEVITTRLPDGRYMAFGRDLTEMQLAQNALQEREKQLARVLEGTDQGYWDWNLETNQFDVSARWETMLGYAPGELDTSLDNWAKYVHPVDLEKAHISVQKHLAGETSSHQMELRCLTKSGEWRWVLTRGRIVEWDANGKPSRMSGTHTDISERKQLEQVQKDASTVFASSYEGIMMVSIDGLISKVNPAFTRITGYHEEEVIGRSPKILSSGRHTSEFYRHLWTDLIKQDFWRGEIWNRRKSGEEYIELLSISTVRDEFGVILHFIGVFSDISQLKAHEAELDKIAHYDTLTGLPNRRLLGDRLGQALIRAQRDQSLLAVCFLDLDGFKAINDQYGHHVGDQLLIGVSEHLRVVLRSNDTLARLGGDEFVILLSDIKNSMESVQILNRILIAASRSVKVDDVVLNVSASIGVSLYPDDNVDTDSLLRHADQAMYIAKNAGKNRYHLFDPESDRKAQFHRSYLELLMLALTNQEFVLYYQPKVDLRDGRIIGAEALIRWVHPERGVLPPAEFLSYIQGSPLDHKLGEWVIEQALIQGERWHQQGLPLRISVNISADHLIQRDFTDHLAFALSQHPTIPPQFFELEVLETAAIADIEQAVDILNGCRQLGVHFSLDDFGTGYSSLTYLRKLPIDTLKIDQSFVRDMLLDSEDLGIVEGVIRLANAFHREVIAEGVETLEHGAALLALGCYLAQGYGIARPMPADQFMQWAEKWQSEKAWLHLQQPATNAALLSATNTKSSSMSV